MPCEKRILKLANKARLRSTKNHWQRAKRPAYEVLRIVVWRGPWPHKISTKMLMSVFQKFLFLLNEVVTHFLFFDSLQKGCMIYRKTLFDYFVNNSRQSSKSISNVYFGIISTARFTFSRSTCLDTSLHLASRDFIIFFTSFLSYSTVNFSLIS